MHFCNMSNKALSRVIQKLKKAKESWKDIKAENDQKKESTKKGFVFDQCTSVAAEQS